MKGDGPRQERETVILFNEADDLATVWTASDVVYNRMIKRGWTPHEDHERSAKFVVPKKAVVLPRLSKHKGNPMFGRKVVG